MELDKFVSRTLLMIAKGVQDAQEKETEFGVSINPKSNGGTGTNDFSKINGTKLQEISFDVAITTEDTSNGEGKISVLGIGVNGKVNSKDITSSKISFKVPMSFSKSEQST
jgi:hypothetical protein